mgnify:CR=1 FL=1
MTCPAVDEALACMDHAEPGAPTVYAAVHGAHVVAGHGWRHRATLPASFIRTMLDAERRHHGMQR